MQLMGLRRELYKNICQLTVLANNKANETNRILHHSVSESVINEIYRQGASWQESCGGWAPILCRPLAVPIFRPWHSPLFAVMMFNNSTTNPLPELTQVWREHMPLYTSPLLAFGNADPAIVLTFAYCVYSLSQKIPPGGPDIFSFFHKRLRIFNQFLNTYYTFISTLDYKYLFGYPQFWRSYSILSATTQFT